MNCTRARLILITTCLLGAGTVSAQEHAPAVAPHILIETVGPNGWRARLGPTNVATMLASEEGRGVWQPQLAPLLGMWEMMVGGEEAFAAVSKRIFDYSGTIRIAVQLNSRGAANVAVALEGDGRSDLEALAADIRGLIEQGVPGEWQDIEVAGQKLAIRNNDGDAVSAPFVVSGRMVLLAGAASDMVDAMGLATYLDGRPLTIDKPKPGSPALQITFDVPAMLAVGDPNKNNVGITKALGFHELERITVSLKAAGPHVELGFDIALNGKARGLVAAFCPDSQGVSGLSQLVPGKASAWKVGRFDFPAMFEGIVSAIETETFFGKPGEVRKDINKACGLDVWKDVLPYMTDEVLAVGSPFQDFDRADEATWMLAFRVNDEAKFRKGFQTVVKNAKPVLLGSETVDVDGVELRRYGNMLSYDLWMAVGNGVFVISAGRDAEEEATTLLRLAKHANFDAGENQETWFQQLERHLPPGHNGLAQLDLMSVLSIPSIWWLGVFSEFGPFPTGAPLDPDEADEQQEKFRELLKANNLTVVRTATGFANAHWHWRLFW
jgi:hypothetical protein